MMNDREVMIFLSTAEDVEIQVINLQSKRISRSFLDMRWNLPAKYMLP